VTNATFNVTVYVPTSASFKVPTLIELPVSVKKLAKVQVGRDIGVQVVMVKTWLPQSVGLSLWANVGIVWVTLGYLSMLLIFDIV